MLSSENVQSATLVIDADPGASDEIFYLMRAPRALTVTAAYMISEQAQNAGTAVKLTLENWGTSGTAVESGGTVAAAVGGTATASRLSARTPAAATVSSTQDYIDSGEWLAVRYAEEGSGWIANDRFTYVVEYVYGKA